MAVIRASAFEVLRDALTAKYSHYLNSLKTADTSKAENDVRDVEGDGVSEPILIKMEEEYACPNPACGRVHRDGWDTRIIANGSILWAGCLVCWLEMMRDLPDRVALQAECDALRRQVAELRAGGKG